MGNARTQIAPTTLRLGVALAFAACVLLVTAVPGVFSVDDDNYLVTVTALQRGQLHVVGTEGLPPSRELLFFEPATRFREVTATPVYSTAPPLYAFMAWPFAWFGLFGLIALNVLAYCATGALVFAMTRRLSQQPRTPWLALGIFMLCTYSIEYAQGLWPHMLAVALTTAAAHAAMRARAEGGARDAAVSGLCAGLAIGTRYQNLALALLIGAGAVLWGTKRARIAVGFVAGLALPLMAASTINALRLGTWNPVSKGPWYITLRLPDESIVDWLRAGIGSTYARVVDLAVWGGTPNAADTMQHPLTAAYMNLGALKKSWAQSCPWTLVGLLAIFAMSLRRGRAMDPNEPLLRREARAAALAIIGVLGLFATNGYRWDGWAFNQRYLLELVPLLVVAFALVIETAKPRQEMMVIGAVACAALAISILRLDVTSIGRHLPALYFPVAVAVLLVIAWWGEVERLFALLAGASLAWSLCIHVGEDVAASHALKQTRVAQLAVAEAVLPPTPSAVLVFWGHRDALGPLQLRHDVTIIDVHEDEAATAPRLVEALLAQGRSVFVATMNLPDGWLDVIAAGHHVQPVVEGAWPIVQIH